MKHEHEIRELVAFLDSGEALDDPEDIAWWDYIPELLKEVDSLRSRRCDGCRHYQHRAPRYQDEYYACALGHGEKTVFDGWGNDIPIIENPGFYCRDWETK